MTGVILWAVPLEMSMIGKFIWFAVGLTLIRTWNTLYFTPMSAFSVEVSDDYNERTTIQAIRSVFYILGMILPVVAMGFFQNKYTVYDEAGNVLIGGQFSVQGYVDFSYVAGSIAIVTTVYLFVMTFSNVPRIRQRQMLDEIGERKKSSLKEVLLGFFNVLKNKDMRYIIAGYSTAMVAATLIITLGFHVFTTFTLATTQMYFLMGGLLFMNIGGQPLWIYISKKTDKKRSMLIGLGLALLGCIGLLIMFLARAGLNNFIRENRLGVALMLPPLMIAGMGTGVLYSMPLALIGDVVAKPKRPKRKKKPGLMRG